MRVIPITSKYVMNDKYRNFLQLINYTKPYAYYSAIFLLRQQKHLFPGTNIRVSMEIASKFKLTSSATMYFTYFHEFDYFIVTMHIML